MFALAIIPLGRATDEASRSKTAADAAALAGAEHVAAVLFQALDSATLANRGRIFSELRCSLGRAPAADFATRNAARLTRYCYRPGRDRIEVHAERLDPGVGDAGPADAGSVASVGMALAHCRWEDDELPPPPTTLLPPAPDPPPVLPAATTLRCDALTLRFRIDTEGTLILASPSSIRSRLRARLVD